MSVTTLPVRYRIRHDTVYEYARKVAHSHQALYLTPRSFERQSSLRHHIDILPSPAVRGEHLDAFGNTITRFELDRPHDRLEVSAHMEVAIQPLRPPPTQDGEPWEQVRDQLCYLARPRSAEWLEAMRFRTESPYVRIKRAFGEYARQSFTAGASVMAVAAALMAKIHSDFTYAPGETQIATPLLDVLNTRRGVCQDYAHFMIACLRTCGLAARYVSGYLRTGTAEPAAAAESELVGSDASHAWVAVFAPPFGWVEFDPTNNLRVASEHVALAWGRDFGDVSPLHGVILGGGQHVLTVRVMVEPLT